MPTECNPKSFEFAPVEGRAVVAVDGGTITSDAGALLLGATDRAIGRWLLRRSPGPGRIEHSLPTLVGQRVFAMALGGACPRAGAARPRERPDRS